MSKQLKGILMILAAAICWGVFPSFSRILYAQGMPAMHAIAVRAFVAGGLYLIIGLIRGTFKGLSSKDLPFLCFYGVAAYLSTFLFYALAVKELSAAMAAMLLYTAPAFVILFNRILYKDKITAPKLAALIVTFLGSALVVRIYDPASLSLNFKGILLGLLSGIGYSMLTVIGRKALQKYDSQVSTFVPTIFVSLIMLFVVPPFRIELSDPVMWLCALGVGVIGSVLPYLLYLGGLSRGVDGGNAVILANAEPVVATICGVLFFHDPLEWVQMLGIVLVILGAILPNLNFKPKLVASSK